jgi:MFS family permease
MTVRSTVIPHCIFGINRSPFLAVIHCLPPMSIPSLGLWRHADFMKLWAGQTVSQFGSMVTRDALPLIGVLVLRASPWQMGLLSAAGLAPVLFIGLLAGAWVDRLRRRPILMAADLGRALLVASIPLAAVLGRLTLLHLYVVAALAGVLTVFFDVAYQAFLPSLVAPEQVFEGNSKLSLTGSLAEIVVPGITGLLVQIISAPFTLAIDALSFLGSAVSLSLIRAPEPPPPAPGAQTSVAREIGEGLRVAWGQPLLRALALSSAWGSFFGSFYGALYSLYALEVLGLTPAVLGLIIACGGLGALFGAALAGPLARRLGQGPALVLSSALMGLIGLLTPLAGGPLWLIIICLVLPQLIGDLFRAAFEISALSLRQAVTPVHLLGRVGASVGFLVGGVATLGLLAGGALGSAIGIRPAIWVAALGGLAATLLLVYSPLPALRGTVSEKL